MAESEDVMTVDITPGETLIVYCGDAEAYVTYDADSGTWSIKGGGGGRQKTR